MIKSMPKWAKITFFILLILCVFIDAWWLTIKYTKPTKEADYRFIVNELKDVEDEEKRTIFTVNYYSNQNNNGEEMFELKINSLIDEDSQVVYSVGIQILGTKDKPISFNNLRLTEYTGFSRTNYRDYTIINNDVYLYNQSNGPTFGATDKINDNSSYLITIGDDYYKLAFKSKKYYEQNSNATEPTTSTSNFLWRNSYVYQNFDINYLVADLYKAVQTCQNGISSTWAFKFAEDMFSYSKKVEGKDNVYEPIDTSTDGGKVINKIENYLCIKVNKYANGVQSSNDSLFKVVRNSPTYGIGEKKEYYNSTQIIELNTFDFDYELQSLSNYKIKLKQSTKEHLEKLTYGFELKIVLDKQILDQNNINVIGFVENSDIYNYKIYNVYLKNNNNLEVLQWT